MPHRNNRVELLERRKYARVPQENVVVCEPFTDQPVRGESGEQAIMSNMSAGGLLIKTEKGYGIGDVLHIEMTLPGWERFSSTSAVAVSVPLDLRGKVVRIEELSDGMYEVGVRITGMDECRRIALERFIYDQVKLEER